MKFCKHCGNQIPDNAVCNCPGAVAERQSMQGGYNQPQYNQQPQGYPQQGYQQAYQQARPAGQGGFNFGSTFLGYFKNPLKASADSQRAKDFITPLIMLGSLFVLLIGVNCCIFGNASVAIRSADGIKDFKDYPLYGFNFGFVVIAALIETVAFPAIYVFVKFLMNAIFVKPFNFSKAFLNSFISFGVHSIVPVMAIVTGGLFYMASGFIGQLFFGFALVWYIVMLVAEIFDEVPAEKRNLVFFIALIGLIAAAIYGVMMTYRLAYQINMGHSIVNVTQGKYDATGWNKSKSEADQKAVAEAYAKRSAGDSSKSIIRY